MHAVHLGKGKSRPQAPGPRPQASGLRAGLKYHATQLGVDVVLEYGHRFYLLLSLSSAVLPSSHSQDSPLCPRFVLVTPSLAPALRLVTNKC